MNSFWLLERTKRTPRARSCWLRLRVLLASALAGLITAGPAGALPQGGQVVSGQAVISQPNGTTLQIQQVTGKVIINWSGFSVGLNELVRFLQPGVTSVAINRVIGGGASVILGQITANGRIVLNNPTSITFGPGAVVNVGGLLATTLNMKDADALAGRYVFQQGPGGLGSIVNQGTITAAPGGFVILSAPSVVNQGTIKAELGTVQLSSGRQLTVDFAGDGLVRFVVDGALAAQSLGADGRPLSSRVSNDGRIQADGGRVELTAKVAGDVLSSVVNNSGIIEARSLVNHGSVVRLIGGDDAVVAANANAAVRPAGQVAGAVTNTGAIDVSAAVSGAAPGQVLLLGERVGLWGTIDARGADQARGGNVTITSTLRTALFGESAIDVSGRNNSDAGRVSVWSESQTTASSGARILARGGEGGGSGGFVEVSGKEGLGFAASVDALAPLGKTGTLLLDPHNIVVATGGIALLSAVDQFTDTPAADATIAPAAINTALANVVLQANNDITFTNAVSIVGAGIGLTAQAGRSININANVATNNAPISLTANETTANGVQNANRDVGTAAITMAAGTSLSSAGANITITMNTGAGLTNNTSGNITLEAVNAGAGHVLVVNNGPTVGSGIARASANELITATSAALDVNGAGGGGGIGTAGAPMRVSVTNLEARSQSGGAFFTSPTLAVNIGGATLGGLTGISTSSNGAVSVTTTGTPITTTEAISANGTGTVTLTAAGAGSSITANETITSGSGAINLTAANGITLSGANADVTTTGAYTANADSDSNGTGVYSQNNVGSAVSSGAATIVAADVVLQGTLNAGAAAVTLRPGLLTETIGVEDASKQFSLTNTELSNVTTTGSVTVGIGTNTGGITIGTDALVNQSKPLTFLSAGNIVVNANGLTNAGAVTMTTSGTGA
ncbi:MAG TPA: filamentous hemagglutinin N-terminal domain-containing protein, partial [Methylomirabilota bacterium]|nr:filamentous hemagglutinin N-terminal domain-containing protein [Methylomirabilota bacterium]